MPKAEGRVFSYSSPSGIKSGFLETMPYKGKTQLIEYSTGEFSAVCPYSGLPDIGELIISYIPSKKIIELKSLKYYLVSYRNVGITQEEATNRIFGDIEKILKPRYLKLITRYNTRGGIDASCTMEKGKPDSRIK